MLSEVLHKAQSSSNNKKRKISPLLLTGAMLTVLFCGTAPSSLLTAEAAEIQGTLTPNPAARAAVPKLEQVRVMLYGESPKYRAAVPAVTLSSTSAVTVQLRLASGSVPVFTAQPSAPIRLYHADSYASLLLETENEAQAKALAQKLSAAGEPFTLLQRTKQGKAVWQTIAGPHWTLDGAIAAGTRAAASGAGVSVPLGPLKLFAGPYASKEEAQLQTAKLEQAGFDADLAVVESTTNPGTPAYVVLTRGTVNENDRQALKSSIIAAVPGLPVADLPANQAYAMIRSEHAVTPASTAAVTAVAFGGAGTKLLARPADEAAGIKVRERFERTYSGAIEISQQTNAMAVINELPFEQYVSAVIGSELSQGWPVEALKAQAVAARTYVLKYGMKHQIAHVTDTTLDQAYKGMDAAFAEAVLAAESTAGEVLVNEQGLIEPLYSSNAGGQTAVATEIWGNPVAYLTSTSSPDETAQKGKLPWYRIIMPDGKPGYIRSDYAKDTLTKNAAGFSIYEATESGVNVRSAPYVDNTSNPSILQVNSGDRFIVIDSVMESNPYAWVRGPYTSSQLAEKMNAGLKVPLSQAPERLQVTERGPSGRVIGVAADGEALQPVYPDAYRSMLGGLPSTKFEIEETGSYTILGAGGQTRTMTPSAADPHIASATGAALQQASSHLVLLDGSGKARIVTPNAQFIFYGRGFGHGLGMSQWGAKGLAEQGYDYTHILKTYYQGVSIIKG